MEKSCPCGWPEKDVSKHTCVQCMILSTLTQWLNFRNVLGVVVDYSGIGFGNIAIIYSLHTIYSLQKQVRS